MSEEQELLARISQVAGQINRHKNHQQQRSSSAYHQNGVYRHQHYSRGRGGPPFVNGHRHRSLVWNGANNDPGEGASAIDGNNGEAYQRSWISKRSRHLQLINSSVYQKEAELRSRSNSHPAEPVAGSSSGEDPDANKVPLPESSPAKRATSGHHLEVHGLTFEVCDGGKRLVRITGASASHNDGHTLIRQVDADRESIPTPERVTISNVTFHRTSNGNLERSGAPRSGCVIIPAQELKELTLASTAVQEKSRTLCKRFSNTGQCPVGPRCPRLHDPDKVAVCLDFLRSGKCSYGAHCDLSHVCSYERVPACSHFQRGKCTKEGCRYAHVRVNPAADVCRAFSTYGFCEKGSLCQDRHVFECPDYARTGECPNKNCRLPHIDRASKLRLSGANEAASGGSQEPFASRSSPDRPRSSTPTGRPSDKADETTIEELIPRGGEQSKDHTLSQQDDFVRL